MPLVSFKPKSYCLFSEAPWPPTSPGLWSLWPHPFSAVITIWNSCFLDHGPSSSLECLSPKSGNSPDWFIASSLWPEQGLAHGRCTKALTGLRNEWVWSGSLGVSSWALCQGLPVWLSVERLVPGIGMLLARPHWGWEGGRRKRGEGGKGEGRKKSVALEALALDGNGSNTSDPCLGGRVAGFNK